MSANPLPRPAPILGWNTRDPVAGMPDGSALIMDNFFPEADGVAVRPPYEEYTTGLPATVESLIEFSDLDGTTKIFAGSDAGVYDVSSSGAVGAAAISSLTNVRFQHTQMATSGGTFTFICNGADAPQTYDGSSWASASITGPTAANLIWCNTHHRRLWFGEKDSLDAWYLDVNSIGGTAKKFPLGGLATLGGYLMGMGTWTRDAGDGSDDVAVFITSEGQILVYAGTNPNSTSTWALQGRYRTGRPIGRRCFLQQGAELLILTEDGMIPISRIVTLDRSQALATAITDQIRPSFIAQARATGSTFGWQPILYPACNMLITNVPISGGLFHQYAFNTLTGAPTRFKGIEASCWGRKGADIFFGGATSTFKFNSGIGDDGTPTQAECTEAYSYFGEPRANKTFTRAELIVMSEGAPTIGLDLYLDFEERAADYDTQAVAAAITSATWGVSKWGIDNWGTDTLTYDGWRGIVGRGRAAALSVQISSGRNNFKWLSTNYLFSINGWLR